MLFTLWINSSVVLDLGKGVDGTGTPKNLQSGSQPSFTLNFSIRSLGTVFSISSSRCLKRFMISALLFRSFPNSRSIILPLYFNTGKRLRTVEENGIRIIIFSIRPASGLLAQKIVFLQLSYQASGSRVVCTILASGYLASRGL